VPFLDLTRNFRRYREALRYVWNTSLYALAGDRESAFADIDSALFREIMTIVLDRDFAVSETHRGPQYPELRVITKQLNLFHLKHDVVPNLWLDTPRANVGDLSYRTLFDFDWENAYRDFEYIECVDSTKTPGEIGDIVLVKANLAKILYRMP
jgi:hypothetical protein